MKKCPFLLLEVLVASSLLLLCAIPLILKPIRAYRAEMQSLEETEKERLADWTFSEIKELLLKHEISWEKLPGYRARTGPFPLDPSLIHIPGREPKKVERSFSLFGQGEKRGAKGVLYRLLSVKVEFYSPSSKKKNAYTYRLAVQRIPKIV